MNSNRFHFHLHSVDAKEAQSKSSSLHSALTQIGYVNAILNADGSKVIETRYHTPYLVHGTMEPVAATARVRDGEIEVWGPIQGFSVQRWYAHRLVFASTK